MCECVSGQSVCVCVCGKRYSDAHSDWLAAADDSEADTEVMYHSNGA